MIGNRTIAVPGPTNIPNRIAQTMYIPLEDHRAPDLGEFTKPLLEDLKKVFKLKNGKLVFLIVLNQETKYLHHTLVSLVCYG